MGEGAGRQSPPELTRRTTMKKRVNNIRIVERGKKFVCLAPDGRALEEFTRFEDAVKWVGETTDFLKPVARKTPFGVSFSHRGTKLLKPAPLAPSVQASNPKELEAKTSEALAKVTQNKTEN